MAPFQGYIQDTKDIRDLDQANPALYQKVIGKNKPSVYGDYRAIDELKVKTLPAADQKQIEVIQDASKRNVLVVTAIFPCVMLVCYLGLVAYFNSKGGYKPKIIISDKEEGLLMTGGAEGPADM